MLYIVGKNFQGKRKGKKSGKPFFCYLWEKIASFNIMSKANRDNGIPE